MQAAFVHCTRMYDQNPSLNTVAQQMFMIKVKWSILQSIKIFSVFEPAALKMSAYVENIHFFMLWPI